MWHMYQKSYIFRPVTLYNKHLSSQYNLTDQIEQVQDNICIVHLMYVSEINLII